MTKVEKVYISVHCGPEFKRFKIIGEHVVCLFTSNRISSVCLTHVFARIMYLCFAAKTASLPNAESVRGEVCAGSWIYHYVHVPKKTNSNFSLDFSVFAFEGAVDFSISESHPVTFSSFFTNQHAIQKLKFHSTSCNVVHSPSESRRHMVPRATMRTQPM